MSDKVIDFHEPVKVALLENCARCGGRHEGLSFEPLDRPHGDLTHFAMCPTTKQPILMSVKVDV
jgi:hypothetical protein